MLAFPLASDLLTHNAKGNVMALPPLMNTVEAANALGVTTKCLEAWRCRGGGPAWRKVGRLVKYAEPDLLTFLAKSVRGGADGAA